VDFAYTADQTSLRDLARQVLSDHGTTQRLVEVEADPERIDRRLWTELARTGLLGVCVPEAYGGSGMGLVELCILLEEVGRTVAPVPVFATLALGALPIGEFGTEPQRSRLLPGAAGGEHVLSAALIEPRNPEPLAPVTRASRDGAAWRIDGVKICVPAAAGARAVIVPARTDGDEIVLLQVDPQQPGVTLERMETTNREMQYRMTLDGVTADDDAVLGSTGAGRDILEWIVDRATVALCSMQVGVTEQALRMTAQYTSTREQFDRPLAAFQAVAQRAADAYIDTEGIRLTTLEAVWLLAQGLPASREVAVAKFWASERAQRVVHAAQHLHGGVGVDLTYPLHRYFLWAKQIELTLGAGTAQLKRLGALLADEATGAAEVSPPLATAAR
jgi:alkylation response protein AidB-like acyl-CoA dehydrogenase